MTQLTHSSPRFYLTSVHHVILRLIVGLLIATLCLWAFGALAEDVTTHERIVQIDQAIADGLHQLATPLSTESFIAISILGQQVVLVLVVVMTIVYLVNRKRLQALMWLVAIVGGQILNLFLKHSFARARPVFQNPLIVEPDFSFPSGHAMMSLITYGMLAYFALLTLHQQAARALAITGAAFLIFMIGLSRIYLGVHYFSDVIGGYIAGGVWLIACMSAVDVLRHTRRGQQQIGEDNKS